MLVLAIAAGAIAVAADGQATGRPPLDAGFRFALAAGVTIASSRADLRARLVLACVALAASREVGGIALSLAALLVIVASVRRPTNRPVLGALAGLLATAVLLRLPDLGPQGTTALIATLAVAPVLLAAYRSLPSDTARRLRRTARIAGVGVVVAIVGVVIALVTGGHRIGDGADAARAGFRAATEGDAAEAAGRLDDAAASFADAERAFGSPLTWPARAVPGLSYQVDAMQQLAAVGTGLAGTAADVAARADHRSVPVEDGRVDVARIESIAGALDDIDAALGRADRGIDEVDPTWLLPPIADELGALGAEVDAASGDARAASELVAVAPALLGAEGPRRYFVAFTTPAESRGVGGFLGSWAELNAQDGRLELTRSGKGTDLSPAPDAEPRALVAPQDYVDRYGSLRVQDQVRDVTLSPDFPSVAQVLAGVYPQTEGGQPIDGVILLDPFAVAAMLRITGPIRVDGYDTQLAPENAPDILLRQQYLDFDGNNEERADFLAEATRATFERFLRSSSIRPAQLGKIFGPLVADGRLLAWSAHAEEQALLERLHLDGAFPHRTDPAPAAGDTTTITPEDRTQLAGRDDEDFFALATDNAGNNKIDIFLSRSVDYATTYDPTTGAVEATATVTLRNDAPSAGLPEYVIKNRSDSGQPMGANWLWFNFYSPHQLVSATKDGQPMPVRAGDEFGLHVYDTYLAVPAGGTTTVVLNLTGSIRPGPTYVVGSYRQPLVHTDEVTVSVAPPSSWREPSRAGGEPFDLSLPPGRAPRAHVTLVPR